MQSELDLHQFFLTLSKLNSQDDLQKRVFEVHDQGPRGISLYDITTSRFKVADTNVASPLKELTAFRILPGVHQNDIAIQTEGIPKLIPGLSSHVVKGNEGEPSFGFIGPAHKINELRKSFRREPVRG